ncbi:MAG: T9SS type A sorting domain-containing protein [Bacteroidetes bacterium]|jgi:hypothetical protein|nr:T9SS type A sorting domain-containing protein [Bacteroidota bacterium]
MKNLNYPNRSLQVSSCLSDLQILKFLLFIFASSWCYILTAQTTTWTGITNTNWEISSNWTSGTPDATKNAIIPNVASNDPEIANGVIAFAKSVTVNANSSLTIQNGASLTIDDSPSNGILNNGNLNNFGLIVIGAIQGTGFNGIYNDGLINNYQNAEIQINGTISVGLYNNFNRTFNNYGKIIIGLNKKTIHSCLVNRSQFYNKVGGEIQLEESDFLGINNLDGTFTNSSKIIIGVNKKPSLSGIHNRDSFKNEMTGDIQIEETSGSGIRNITGTFTNNGKITIGLNKKPNNFGIQNQASFNNSSYGEIQIEEAGQHGIYNHQGTFDNSGIITIGSVKQPVKDGINNTGLINNLGCAEIFLYDKLQNNSSFSNEGLLSLKTLENHSFGTFTSIGIIEDIHGSANNLGSNANPKIIVAPALVNSCQIINPAFELDNVQNFNISVFSDAAGTISAGSFNKTTNTFTANPSLSLGVNSLYVKVEDLVGGCTRILSWELTTQNCCNSTPNAQCKNHTAELNSSGQATISVSDIDNNSTDNCGIQSMSLDETNFDCNDLGAQTVTLTVTNVSGLTATCTAEVTVEDNIAPIVTCKNATIELDATGNVTLSPFTVYSSTSDNCGVAALSVSPNMFDCTEVGTQSVTLTVSDYDGNLGNCSATVNIEDNLAPVAICKDHIVLLNSSGVGNLSVSDVDNGSSDNCGITNSSIDLPSSFSCNDIGVHLVTLSLTDANGNSSSCTANVTVADDIDPEANCKDITITCSGGVVTINPLQVDDGSSDNCTFSLSLDQTVLTCSSTPVTVTLTATDDSGNVDDCTSLVSFNVQSGSTSISINDVSKLEGNWWGFTFYQFELERSGGTNAVSVDYATADGTATLSNNDYIAQSGSINWSNGGSDIKYLNILVRKDNVYEPDEVFYINLSNPTGGAIISDGQGEAELINDDVAPTVILGETEFKKLNSQQLVLNPVSLYPNPTQSELNIKTSSEWLELGFVRVELIDNSGRKINSFEIEQIQETLIVSDLQNGIYQLVFFPKNGTIVSKRFVKIE